MGQGKQWLAVLRLSDPGEGAPRYDRERSMVEEAMADRGLLSAEVEGRDLVLHFGLDGPADCDVLISACRDVLGRRSPRVATCERLTALNAA